MATKRQDRGRRERDGRRDDATTWRREIEHEPHFLHRLPKGCRAAVVVGVGVHAQTDLQRWQVRVRLPTLNGGRRETEGKVTT